MKIKVRLVQPNRLPSNKPDSNDPWTISWSDEVEYIANCPQVIEITRRDYPQQNFLIEITE